MQLATGRGGGVPRGLPWEVRVRGGEGNWAEQQRCPVSPRLGSGLWDAVGGRGRARAPGTDTGTGSPRDARRTLRTQQRRELGLYPVQ